MLVWFGIIFVWCSVQAIDPALLVAKARINGAIDRAQLHTSAYIPVPQHPMLLAPYPIEHAPGIVGVPDPRNLHLHTHHQVHHHPGSFWSDHQHHAHFIKHQPVKRPNIHLHQTIVNKIQARNRGGVGSHLFQAPSIWSLPPVHQHRYRRALPQVAAARLAVDPNVRVNVIGTLDNVKDATKDICENNDSPLYHMREAIGSARDVLFSVVRMAPTGLLVPTSYRVATLQDSDKLGAINPALLNEGGVNKIETSDISPIIPIPEGEEAKDAFSAVYVMLRNGLKGARNSAQHVGDTVHSVRRAVLAVPKSALKLFLPYLRSVELQKSHKEGVLRTANPTLADPEPQKFAGAGRLLELIREIAASDSSHERVASAHVKCEIPKKPDASKTYKDFINKIKKDYQDKKHDNKI